MVAMAGHTVLRTLFIFPSFRIITITVISSIPTSNSPRRSRKLLASAAPSVPQHRYDDNEICWGSSRAIIRSCLVKDAEGLTSHNLSSGSRNIAGEQSFVLWPANIVADTLAKRAREEPTCNVDGNKIVSVLSFCIGLYGDYWSKEEFNPWTGQDFEPTAISRTTTDHVQLKVCNPWLV
ncbi:hypothetical protein BVC80_1835g364 [Macleaya cordata]|uniref:Uncharacterized protein n=1 Tax=Macleaya cordata TaxID=56857 RepID=A0A200R5I9_MACCD|nr:hypothetical protein BVC80_1835g364 [Macleaya cordata]